LSAETALLADSVKPDRFLPIELKKDIFAARKAFETYFAVSASSKVIEKVWIVGNAFLKKRPKEVSAFPLGVPITCLSGLRKSSRAVFSLRNSGKYTILLRNFSESPLDVPGRTVERRTIVGGKAFGRLENTLSIAERSWRPSFFVGVGRQRRAKSAPESPAMSSACGNSDCFLNGSKTIIFAPFLENPRAFALPTAPNPTIPHMKSSALLVAYNSPVRIGNFLTLGRGIRTVGKSRIFLPDCPGIFGGGPDCGFPFPPGKVGCSEGGETHSRN